MTVEVAARPVVELRGAGIGMTGQNLRIAEWDAGIQGICDRSMT